MTENATPATTTKRTYVMPLDVLEMLEELSWLERDSFNGTLVKVLRRTLPILINKAKEA